MLVRNNDSPKKEKGHSFSGLNNNCLEKPGRSWLHVSQKYKSRKSAKKLRQSVQKQCKEKFGKPGNGKAFLR